jgi:hypothetical protein
MAEQYRQRYSSVAFNLDFLLTGGLPWCRRPRASNLDRFVDRESRTRTAVCTGTRWAAIRRCWRSVQAKPTVAQLMFLFTRISVRAERKNGERHGRLSNRFVRTLPAPDSAVGQPLATPVTAAAESDRPDRVTGP